MYNYLAYFDYLQSFSISSLEIMEVGGILYNSYFDQLFHVFQMWVDQ